MAFTGSAPNKTYQRTDGVRTGSAVNVTADNAGVNDTAALADARENDMAAAISTSWQINGDNQPNANLPMNTKKFTGMAQGSARTDSLRIDQVQDGDLIYAGTVGGTANAIELTMSPVSGGPVEGMMVLFIPGGDNTDAVTVDLDGDGAAALELNSAALVGGELQAGQPAIICHDGTNWQLVTPAVLSVLASTASGQGASLIGIEDSGGLITATTVEGALAENRTAIDAIEADLLANYQPLDSDLTAIAALTTTSFGRGLLESASAAALYAAIKQAASASATGAVELATDAEAITGTDTARAVTPAALAASRAITTPTGAILAWTTATAPTGWLECDGSAVSRTTYAALFAVIAETYGNGDGSTTFNLPDLRGEFIRGFDNSAGNDPDAASRTDRGDGTTGDNVGTKQDEDFLLHGHPLRVGSGGSDFVNTTGGIGLSTSSVSNYAAFTGTLSNTPGEQISGSGGNETRPRNVAMMWIIKT